MNNNSKTQVRSPHLTESNPQKNAPVLIYLWLLIVGVGALSIAIAAVAVISLTNTGRGEKDPTKQTTIATQKAISTENNWLPTIALLGAGVASAAAIYKWRPNLPIFPKRGLTRRQQRKLLQKAGGLPTVSAIAEIPLETAPEPVINNLPIIDKAPIITVLPPEETQTSDLGEQSLAEMMDIRKHLSLSTILQEFKRPN